MKAKKPNFSNQFANQAIEKKQMKKIVGGNSTVPVDQTKVDSVLNLIR